MQRRKYLNSFDNSCANPSAYFVPYLADDREPYSAQLTVKKNVIVAQQILCNAILLQLAFTTTVEYNNS